MLEKQLPKYRNMTTGLTSLSQVWAKLATFESTLVLPHPDSP